MASSTNPAPLPSAADRQGNFEKAVSYSLHLWPALTLAVQNGWGGPDSADKRDWFAGAVVDLFPEFTDAAEGQQTKVTEEPDMEYVETFLLQVMIDEFEVNTDDDSGMEVAGNIIRARAQCAIGQYDEVNRLWERFQNLRGERVGSMFRQAEDADQDTDWESDDDDDDDNDNEGGADAVMTDAAAPKEKPAPEIDEDGFTTVTHRKR
ncbi:rRNA accumulation-related protein [Conoideocrella luteorostrata]|uniref:rRNA accumulation-related protein n=1 Tax=Conoideocrella luteorostrata TaxID=1105319 RepID=A0AAJ0CLV1_9HYPO|nr:rRNA accumulation-related protein [Conoideocrella luteorostrata]